jgi:hypothetical protein
MSVCTNCEKIFRDSFDLKRHGQRKKPCKRGFNANRNNINLDTSGNVIINNNLTVNNNLTINVFGKEDLSHINPQAIIDSWREINRGVNDEYIRAGKLVINFHGLVRQNPLNDNVTLSNIYSPVTKTITDNGIVTQHVKETVSDVVKTRAGQLVTFKDSIDKSNDRVFKIPKNISTWNHIEQFGESGLAHEDLYTNTRSIKTLAKVALI